jgi:hypothetical protein
VLRHKGAQALQGLDMSFRSHLRAMTPEAAVVLGEDDKEDVVDGIKAPKAASAFLRN